MLVRLAGLQGTVVRPRGPEQAPPALLLHGLGLGRWAFERMQETLADHGVPSVAVDLPGHGLQAGASVRLEEVVGAVADAAEALPGCAIVGHGLGGYVAQVVAARVRLSRLALLMPWPTGDVPLRPTWEALPLARRVLGALALGRPVPPDPAVVEGLGLAEAPADVRRLLGPWPEPLTGEALRRPHRVDPRRNRAPVLTCIGLRDRVVPWTVGRRVGEWWDAVIWRFDDVGHVPMLQPEGRRVEEDVARWVVEPLRRKVTEVEAWRPGEGRGLAVRDEARGEHGRKRSAYGQRAGRDADHAVARWDQNLVDEP